jgi:hypothetical protein
MAGLVTSCLHLAGRPEGLVRPVMEKRVGQFTDPLVEQDEHEGGFSPLIGQAVTVVSSDTLEQAMGLYLAPISHV